MRFCYFVLFDIGLWRVRESVLSNVRLELVASGNCELKNLLRRWEVYSVDLVVTFNDLLQTSSAAEFHNFFTALFCGVYAKLQFVIKRSFGMMHGV